MPIRIVISVIEALLGLRSLVAIAGSKKTLITGPQGSGKTTFLRHIARKKQDISEGPSGAPRDYSVDVDGALFHMVTDFSGADVWLENSFDVYMKDKDFVLFFFDVNACLSDVDYQRNVSARLDSIHKYRTNSQKVLLVGSHVDVALSPDYNVVIPQLFADKSYRNLFENIVYIDATEKNCIKKIVNGLKNA